MKYIEPPTKKQPKYLPPPKPTTNYFWVRLLLGVGTILVIFILSQIFKARKRKTW